MILDGEQPGKKTGGLKGLPVSEYLVDNASRIVITPVLHLHLGMINTIIYPRLKSVLTIASVHRTLVYWVKTLRAIPAITLLYLHQQKLLSKLIHAPRSGKKLTSKN